MKVITLISGGDIGGAKTHVLSLLHGLGKTEQVRLVCFREGEFAEDARKLGIDTCVMEVSVGAAIGRLTQMIREEGFQIIHCHGARANLTGAILRRKVRVPIVTTVHSDYRLDYLGRPLHRLTYGTINTIALRMFDYHIGVSDAMAQLLISRGFDPQTMFAIYNGIDFTPVTPKLGREDYLRSVGLEVQDDTVVFGIAARLDPVKDMPTLIRGFSIAVKDHPNIRLLIAGEGEQRQMLEALAAQDSSLEEIQRQYLQAQQEWAEWSAAVPEGAPSGGAAQFAWPLPGYTTLSSDFGTARRVYGAKDVHTGMDIPAPAGTPVYAAADGAASLNNHWVMGISVKLDHGGSLATLYGHLSACAVKDGDLVEKGQLIGYVGSTGNSTGNHLHFEVDLNGDPVSAWPYLNAE